MPIAFIKGNLRNQLPILDEMTIEQVITVVSASSVLIAYIIGEGLVDAARLK